LCSRARFSEQIWRYLLRVKRKKVPVENAPREKRPAWPLLAGLALVALLAGVSCGGAAAGQGVKKPTGDEAQAAAERSQLETEQPQSGANLGHPSLGGEDAPVVLIEYADYQ
jgi:hypothetical protein